MQQISKRYRVSVHYTVSFVTQTSTNVRATHVRTERIVPLLTSTDSPADVCRDSQENVAKQVIEAECRYNCIVITVLQTGLSLTLSSSVTPDMLFLPFRTTASNIVLVMNGNC